MQEAAWKPTAKHALDLSYCYGLQARNSMTWLSLWRNQATVDLKQCTWRAGLNDPIPRMDAGRQRFPAGAFRQTTQESTADGSLRLPLRHSLFFYWFPHSSRRQDKESIQSHANCSQLFCSVVTTASPPIPTVNLTPAGMGKGLYE